MRLMIVFVWMVSLTPVLHAMDCGSWTIANDRIDGAVVPVVVTPEGHRPLSWLGGELRRRLEAGASNTCRILIISRMAPTHYCSLVELLDTAAHSPIYPSVHQLDGGEAIDVSDSLVPSVQIAISDIEGSEQMAIDVLEQTQGDDPGAVWVRQHVLLPLVDME